MYIKFDEDEYLLYDFSLRKIFIGDMFNFYYKNCNDCFELYINNQPIGYNRQMNLVWPANNFVLKFIVEHDILIACIGRSKFVIAYFKNTGSDLISLIPYNQIHYYKIAKIVLSFLDRDNMYIGINAYVYKNPRLLLEGEETYTYNEISKVYTIDDNLNYVKELYDEQVNIKSLKNYLILPIKYGNIKIPESEITSSLGIYTTQLVYPLGKNFTYIKTQPIKNIFRGVLNILLGIKEMMKMGINHFDIKMDNIVIHEDKYKLVDLDSLKIKDSYFFEYYKYHAWPVIPILILAYENDIKHMEHGVVDFLMSVSNKDKIVINNFENYMSYIPDKYKHFKKRMFEERSCDINNIQRFYEYYLKHKKQNLIDRIDIYSFGITLLEILIKIPSNILEKEYDEIINIITLCCYQNEENISIEIIVEKYNLFLKNLI